MISGAIVIITLIVTTYTIVKSHREFAENNKKDRLSKTIDMAREYADLIKHISYIQAVITRDESLVKILSKVKLESITEFNNNELKKIFTTEEVLYLDSFFRHGNINTGVLYGCSLNNKNSTINFSELAEVKENSITYIRLISEFYDEITEVLNRLEYISMLLNNNVTDEAVLFPSLHQSLGGGTISVFPNCKYKQQLFR